ncbi:NAD-dependent epimerase [Vibrio cholerae]|uniref:NAD-dependent epimerase n=1 Tax=Vibrio cholerae TaxID=666 RepID=UPI0004E46E36|nr:NAD-dependent epimerase [Vibrio cholerae]EGQ8492740.1 SDR family NAD(P)-dependent oxidoreductase [Vibrio cholerae]KFD86847.1 3-beta hydroxysteroid dehydrogenase/isomerase family protein [Vibrio cholerae]KFE04159.1 3-beta hydroxysteroid dehydrogenase/isomerase family protein [Vibrio cholerae]MCX9483561.1 NAD-dependent epimerase [Vibrio cholerae]TXZ24813.1 NAD-dependent epimerase [Vibrio cholerae]
MKYLVTGAAGFIGSATVKKLTEQGHDVVGIDNINDYYDVNLKQARLARIEHPLFSFIQLDIADREAMASLFATQQFDRVIHLAAQAGVRYSLENPHAYADSNLVGHLNILEGCRQTKVKHLIYASSSSVYGLNAKVPFATSDSVDHPVSLYAATKKSNELMAHSYSHLYDIPTTGLRFFTVYGSWGRPDMAPFIFTKKILDGETIDINNNGDMWRDFTHVDDIVEGVVRIADVVPTRNEQWTVEKGTPATSSAPYSVYNIGHGSPINLMAFVEAIENELGIEAKKNFREMQPGDVYQTYADTEDLFSVTGYKPQVTVKEGVKEFVTWYRDFYNQ